MHRRLTKLGEHRPGAQETAEGEGAGTSEVEPGATAVDTITLPNTQPMGGAAVVSHTGATWTAVDARPKASL